MSYEGFLYKRPASPNPPSMEYCYCLLLGTTLWDFSAKDDILKGNPPLTEVEIIGVSEWDGKGRMHQYSHAFVFVTLLGTTYHACAGSEEELRMWIQSMRLGLHLYFHTSNKEHQDVRVKANVFKMPQAQKNKTCPITEKKFSHFDRGELCNSCGKNFVQEFCAKNIPLPQYGYEISQTVCDDCYVTQKFIMYLKLFNGMLQVGCGELSALKGQLMRGSLKLFAQSRLDPSKRVYAALELFTQGALSETEMEELVRVDWMYQQESNVHEVNSFKITIENRKNDVMHLLKLLMDKSDEGQDVQQFQSVLQCMFQFADADLDIIDFFWPQLVHLHFLLLPAFTWTQVIKVELLEDFFLGMCLKSATLAVKLVWTLLGYLEDLENLDERSMRLVLLGIEVEAILVGPEAFAGRNPYAHNRMFRSLLRPTSCQLTLIIYQLRAVHRCRTLLHSHFPDFFHTKQCLYQDGLQERSTSEANGDERRVHEAILTESSSDEDEDGTKEYMPENEGKEQEQEKKEEQLLGEGDEVIPESPIDSEEDPVLATLNELVAQVASEEDPVLATLNELVAQVEAFVVGQEIQNFILEAQKKQENSDPVPTPPLPSDAATPPAPGSESPLVAPSRRPNGVPSFRRLHTVDLVGVNEDDEEHFRLPSSAQKKKNTLPTLKIPENSKMVDKKQLGSLSKPALPAQFFKEQIRFIRRLGYIAEKLRFVDPADKDARKEMLVKELEILEESGITGFLPLCSATEAVCRIVRIPTTEGHVFRTKARAPTLIVFEVIRPANEEPSGLRKMKSMPGQFTPHITGKEIEEMIEIQVDQNMEEALSSMPELGESFDLGSYASGDENPFSFMEGEKQGNHPNQTKEAASSDHPAKLRRESSDKSPMTLKQKMIELKDKIPEEGANLRKRMIELKQKIPEDANNLRKRIVDLKDRIPGKHIHRPKRRGSDTNKNTLLKGSNHLALQSSQNIETLEVFQTLQKIDSSGALSSIINPSDVRQEDIERINESIHSLPASKYQESSAVKISRQLYMEGVISKEELAECLENDLRFQLNLERSADLDLQFNVALAFGESWGDKQARIQRESPMGLHPGWELHSLIVKSNDDLRQEVCMIQLIELCQHIFLEAGIDLWLRPYRIISTSATTGLIETITDAMSLDALKKREGYVSLADHFERTYGPESSNQRIQSMKKYVASLAAYSLICYMFQIKDRHNGNILLDTDGHIVHIDFGFILGIAPGGYWSIETCPFKLTTEMVDVMGGLKSRWFMEFVVSFTCGFLALQEQADRITSVVEIMSRSSLFPCFEGKDGGTLIKNLRDRFRTDLDKEQVVSHCLEIIKNSYNNYGMRQYDNFQWFTNGIMP